VGHFQKGDWEVDMRAEEFGFYAAGSSRPRKAFQQESIMGRVGLRLQCLGILLKL
jgi:hypothetical protein